MKKWTVTEVSQASGISESAIGGYFSNRHISTRGGITLLQVLEMLQFNKENGRDKGINDSEKVRLLVKILQIAGYETPYVFQDEC